MTPKKAGTVPETPKEKPVQIEGYYSSPENYEIGRTKYIVITGSVISGVGKGTFSGALCTLLSCHGLRVSPVKFDGYINVDAGTLNPYRHGEVFVLDDGTECDLDLGSYERALHRNLSRNNYLTSGKIFKMVIDKERAGKYLGRDVQFIPHVTGEIKMFLRQLALDTKADVVLVEVGGTIGDIENSYFIEAMRELRYEEGSGNVLFANVTYIVEPESLKEHKSKAAQIGLRQLLSLGVQPEIIVCRSQTPTPESVREKISVFGNVPVGHVYNLYDFSNVYEIPLMLQKMNLDKELFALLRLSPRQIDGDQTFRALESFVRNTKEAKRDITVAIIGKYTNVHDSYLSVIKSLEHAAAYHGAKVRIKWIEAADFETGKISAADVLKGIDGLIVPGGFGTRGVEGKITAIKYARENNMPYLGLCYGMQLAVVEYARNVCGLKDANTTEADAKTTAPVVDVIKQQRAFLEKSKYGGTMRLGSYAAAVKPGTKVLDLYKKVGRLDTDKKKPEAFAKSGEKFRIASTKGTNIIFERHRHRYEVNPKYVKKLESAGLVFSGSHTRADGTALMEFIEIPKHKYFVGTQAHPEFMSRPNSPAPLFYGFIEACVK